MSSSSIVLFACFIMSTLFVCLLILHHWILTEGLSRAHVPQGCPSSMWIENAMTQQVLRLDFSDALGTFTIKDLKDNIRKVTSTDGYELPRGQQLIFDNMRHLSDHEWLDQFAEDPMTIGLGPNRPRLHMIYRYINVRVQIYKDKRGTNRFVDVRLPNVKRMMNISLDLIKETLQFKLRLDPARQVIVYWDVVLTDALPLYNGQPTVQVQLLIKPPPNTTSSQLIRDI